MQSSNKPNDRSSDVERLANELKSARQEIQFLRARLRSVGLELTHATDLSDKQGERLVSMSNQSIADAATIFASNEQIKNQSLELDVARKSLLLQAELEAANKELETFSYSVSHDLRSPLRAINGFAKALAEDYAQSLPEEARRYLEHIENSAVKMGTLIDDLLSFSRLSRLDLSHVLVDMRALAQIVWTEVAGECPTRRMDFVIGDLPKVNADRAMIKQVLVNLISNAVKFSAPREVANISLSHEERASEDVFLVKDNGVGFDSRYSDKLFGPFQRLHKAKDFPGTGIGLALVQRIVHRHGGKVWAESTLGEGSSFYFSIPKQRSDHERD